VHLIRNTFRLTSKRDWDAMKRDVKLIYTAVNAAAARTALDELAEKWGKQYGAVIRPGSTEGVTVLSKNSAGD
jgi:putative transposase